MSVVWAASARADLRHAMAYIANDSPAAALRLRERIETVAKLLEMSPHAGRRSIVAGLRELTVSRTRYRLVYRVAGDDVQIVRLIHSARDWPAQD